jgi:hypothetical protein
MTMEGIQQKLQADPSYRANYEKGIKDFELSQKLSSTFRTLGTSNLTAPVTIPVVVHIILPNPDVVTDADVQAFINRLNADFSGLNADSANGTNFYGVRGHSMLRFALAKRDPAGKYTTGIERKVGTAGIDDSEPQPMKSTTSGGLNPWPHTEYYNLWVGEDASGFGILGIAPEIGPGSAATDGVCVDYRVFSNSACYTYPDFNLGRTVVHEIGHNFGLYHTFQGGCNNADYQQLTSPGMSLPPSLLSPADDTPGQNGATSGCPNGTAPSGCATSPNPPGKMYQNYMDYTNDVCYSMFTKGQVDRMHYVLETYRPGYLTTQGHIAPASMPSLDASIMQVVNPGGSENVGCSVISYPSINTCAGPFSPKAKIQNLGSATLTSITVSYTMNGGAPVTQTFTVNLIPGSHTVVTFPAVNLPVGTYNFTYSVSAPNGGTDAVSTNNSASATLTLSPPVSMPLSQDFETAPFPSANWYLYNPNGDFSWIRVQPGSVGSYSMAIDNYNNDAPGRIDELRSASISTAGILDSAIITFDVAHKNYSGSSDKLEVLISRDCGATWTAVFSKSGTTLATAGASTAAYISPVASDWRSERIVVGGSQISGGQFMVAFRNVNDYGNNIFLDNINVSPKASRDIRLVSISSPGANACSPIITPTVTVMNAGAEALTGFSIGYRIDNGPNTIRNFTQALNPGESATLTLAPGNTTSGVHQFRAFTANPVSASGTGDTQLSNDTLTKTFTVVNMVNSVSETFEGSFPPPGWTIINLDNKNTWTRSAVGRAGSGSAFIDNFNNDARGQADDMRLPTVNTVGVDSLIFSFDLAHKNHTGSNDSLIVLMSTDCGATFTRIYAKGGSSLATAGSSNLSYMAPAAGDWRTERIAVRAADLTTGNAIFLVRNINNYGNNIFVDNVQVQIKFPGDLQLVSINQAGVVCAPGITPSVTVKNVGTQPVTGFKVSYTVGAGLPREVNLAGLNLAYGSTMNINLPSSPITTGQHTIRAYLSNMVTSGGNGDYNSRNDTLTKLVSLTGITEAPLTENFQNNFVPDNWAINNPDARVTWSLANVGQSSDFSAFINNRGYTGALGEKDDLYSPLVTYGGVDSVILSFDVAAVSYYFPGTTGQPMDTLEVLVTKDCGNTFTTVYKKWGDNLQTVIDPAFPRTAPFTPSSNSDWRGERIDLTQFAADGSVQVVFRNTSNNGNNIYLDNVRLITKILPAQLKAEGFLLLPSPFQTSFNLWHYQVPSDLRYVTVHNTAGQLVWKKQFPSGADKVVTVDLQNGAAGMYMVTMGYSDDKKTVTRRVIKQ